MNKWLHPTLYNGCNYLSMLGLKLNHVSKSGPRLFMSWFQSIGQFCGIDFPVMNLACCVPEHGGTIMRGCQWLVCSWLTSPNGNISVLLALCDRWPVNSPHKSQWRAALMFPLICAWIKGRVNNSEAGDLRRHRSHYDVTVIYGINCMVTIINNECFITFSMYQPWTLFQKAQK